MRKRKKGEGKNGLWDAVSPLVTSALVLQGKANRKDQAGGKGCDQPTNGGMFKRKDGTGTIGGWEGGISRVLLGVVNIIL